MHVLGKLVLAFLGIFFLLAILIFRPVPKPTKSNLVTVQGSVIDIVGHPENFDITFYLKDHETRYYVNRGMENGLDVDDLRDDLLNRNITIRYPKYWTPLDPKNTIKHISEIRHGAEVIYTEIRGDF